MAKIYSFETRKLIIDLSEDELLKQRSSRELLLDEDYLRLELAQREPWRVALREKYFKEKTLESRHEQD